MKFAKKYVYGKIIKVGVRGIQYPLQRDNVKHFEGITMDYSTNLFLFYHLYK